MNTDTIYRWIARIDPEGPRWTDPSFDGYRKYPKEIRFLLSSDKLEFEVQNGGLPQFLWNVFYHYHWILDDCEVGYEMIGAHAQSISISEFRKLCDNHKQECLKYINHCIDTRNFQVFNDWMEVASITLRSEKETLFYSDSDLQIIKETWYSSNSHRIKMLIRSIPK